ncbi:MAG: hypothetical protein ACOZAO_05930 [Patescibacteria group bacterium]
MCLNSGSTYGVPQDIETISDLIQLVIFVASLIGLFAPITIQYLMKKKLTFKSILLLLTKGLLIWIIFVVLSKLLLNTLCI